MIVDTAGGSARDGHELYRKIRRALDRLIEKNNYEAVYTISGGIVSCQDNDALRYEKILKLSTFALQQAKEFNDVAEITGIVLTKMDGTAKGGIAVAIHAELGVPVKYIGVGETIDDLQKFNADDFVNALFERPKDDVASEEVSENE